MARKMRTIRVDRADRVDILVDDHHRVSSLKNLKGIGHIRDARDARQITLSYGIGSQAVFKVLLLLRRGPRLVGDFIPFNHALPCRNVKLRMMVLNVPRGGVENLPDALQVRPAVRRAWRGIRLRPCRRGLTSDRYWRERDRDRHDRRIHEPISHDLRACPYRGCAARRRASSSWT